tara:strand:- start:426 stop:620 length:195 start_codon:yes stop_codon:yes gene_type:complete
MFKGASSLSISKRNLGPITAAMEKRVALVAPERVHVFERGNMRQTSFYLIKLEHLKILLEFTRT